MVNIKRQYIVFKSFFISIIKTVLAVIRFRFSADAVTAEGGYTHLLNLFCLTGGWSNTILHIVLRQPKYTIAHAGILDLVRYRKYDEGRVQLLNQLRDEGYVTVDNALNPQSLEDILFFSKTNPGIAQRMDFEQIAPSKYTYFSPENPTATKFSFSPSSVLQNRTVQKLLADESFLDLAQSYLGGCPIIDDVQLWWSTSFKVSPDKEAAQYWHFDMNRPKWVKFFFYITDVTTDTGPHCFIRGTHVDGAIPWPIRKLGYTRLDDHQVLSTYPSSDILEFTGAAGTLIIEDTRGLHKAKNLIAGNRLILEITYCSSLFGGSFNNIEVPSNADSLLLEKINNMPQIYQVFRIVPPVNILDKAD